jgi:glycosyltransferase involved in cell wall biosynthesis
MKLSDEILQDRPRRALQSPARGSPGPLKICFILEPLHAGVGRHVVDVACDLAGRGHDIHVLYSPVRLQPQFLSDLSAHARIHCHAIKMTPGLCAGDIAAFWQVKDYVKRNGPFDIVHGESSKGGGFARLLKLFGTRNVLYSPHAFVTLSPLPFAKRWAFKNIELLLSRLTDTIVCSSQNEHEHAIALGISPRKLALVVNGTAFNRSGDRASVRKKLGLSAKTVVIGFAGRLEAQKAPQRLIQACLRLLPQVPQLHLLMIGDGPLRGELQACMNRAGLNDRVTWCGAVDAVRYMPAMDVFAMPSLYEGFAYVLLEALHTGLPIVATPVGGVSESVAPGKNGFIGPHNPIEPLVSALRQLGLDGDLRHRMALAAKERAEDFSITRMVDGLESLYRQTVSSAGPVAPQDPTGYSASKSAQPLIWKRARACKTD